VGVGDLVTFGCALALVFSPLAGASYTLNMGYIMVANQARGDRQIDSKSVFTSCGMPATCAQLLRTKRSTCTCTISRMGCRAHRPGATA
jgi:hypothetical protein